LCRYFRTRAKNSNTSKNGDDTSWNSSSSYILSYFHKKLIIITNNQLPIAFWQEKLIHAIRNDSLSSLYESSGFWQAFKTLRGKGCKLVACTFLLNPTLWNTNPGNRISDLEQTCVFLYTCMHTYVCLHILKRED
jgi:hypothetical protein